MTLMVQKKCHWLYCDGYSKVRGDVRCYATTGKHILAETNAQAAVEEPVYRQRIGTTVRVLLETMFSLRSVQSGYKKNSLRRVNSVSRHQPARM
jgi:hypothetical protein